MSSKILKSENRIGQVMVMQSRLSLLVAYRLLIEGLESAARDGSNDSLPRILGDMKCLDEPADNRVVKLRQWPVPSIATRIIPRR